MTKILLLVSALLLLGTGSGAAQTSVWKVTSGDRTLFLGGTFHLLRATDFPLPPEYATAFAASETLCFEVDLAEMQSPRVMGMILGQGMYTDGTTLQSKLTPEAWAAIEAHCARAKIPVAQINTMKPWMFILQIAMMELLKMGVTDQGVDTRLHRDGLAAGKKMAALETIDEQIGFMIHGAEGHESEYVITSLEELGSIHEQFGRMIAAWRSGDVVALDDLLSREMREKYPEMFDLLIVQRNRNWMPKIEAMLASEPVEFVLVGAGHMVGDEGLIAQLRARGATVEQLVAAPR